MKTRIIAGLAMAPLLVIFYFGGMVLRLLCFAVAIVGLHEFFKGFRESGSKPSYPIACVFALALYILDMVKVYYGRFEIEWFICWLVLLVMASCIYLFVDFDNKQVDDCMVTILGVIYIVLFSCHIIFIDETAHRILIWLVIFAAFGTDIFAYFAGYFVGKHKLCPTISPKKTIEGSIGGIIGSMVLCGIFGLFAAGGEYFVHSLVIGAIGSIVSQFGDLTASIFKRKIGIKDYGNLIPGHGGILDRFDSVLFTAPFVYYYIIFVIGV